MKWRADPSHKDSEREDGEVVVNATRLFNKGVPGHVRPLQKGDRVSERIM
jgi:hypothetical protein